jgi:hypothetical protein
MSLVHRAFGALLSAALAVTLVSAGGSAQAATADPAHQAGDWLAGQLRHGLIHNGQFHFDDYGLTVDTAFALRAIGGHPHAVHRIRRKLAAHVSNYTTGVDFGAPGDRYAGAIAKLLVFAEDTGARPRHFGGFNLVRRLAARVSTSSPAKGRIEDKSGFGDNANTIGQIFAVRGLLRAGSPLVRPASRFLLKQQCGAGYFRLSFDPDPTAADQSCTRTSVPDADVTALAVVELWRFRGRSGALGKSLVSARSWLRRHQKTNGSFGGSGPTSASNSNSTGLAGWAFGASGACRAAGRAAGWLSDHQVSGHLAGTPLAGERGAIAYDRAAMKAARRDGITQATRDQWRRATAQAAPALQALHGCFAG